jgi:hypothetical protein
MARGQHRDTEDTAPPPRSDTLPPPAQAGHDFTLQAIMEMQKTLGQFTAKIDRLVEDSGKLTTRLGEVEKAVDRVKTGAIVGAAIFSVVGVVLWWAIGDRITVAVRTAITTPSIIIPPPQAK